MLNFALANKKKRRTGAFPGNLKLRKKCISKFKNA